ncbi:MAG: hypothetical protein LUG21_08465 [Clostridiales bacterium]|nr:hypothetical protein [Clostridiales bacterium]
MNKNFISQKNKEIRKHNFISEKIKIIMPIVICILIILFAAFMIAPFLSVSHNPDKFAAKYIEYMQNENWEKLYSHSDFAESPFIEKEEFIKLCGGNPNEIFIDFKKTSDYKIEFDKKDGNKYFYSINYITYDSTYGVYYLTVNKTKNGIWLYDSYCASPAGSIISDEYIYAPEGSTVEVDGIEVPCTNTITGKSSEYRKEIKYCEYKIEQIFIGSHNLKIQNPFCNDFNTEFEVTKTDNKYYAAVPLSDSCFSQLLQSAENTLNMLYSHTAQNNINTDDSVFSSDFSEEKLNEIIAEIDKTDYFGSDALEVSEFKITGIKNNTEINGASLSCFNELPIEISVSFDYEYNIKNIKEDTAEKRTGTGEAAFVFVYENRQWKIKDISSKAYF